MADPEGGPTTSFWNVLVGAPRSARGAGKERITPVEGLSALSLDALTSVAYGPEAIILVLAVAGAGALHLVLPITIAIIALLAILVFSYRQVIDAYPMGGGAYAVSRANFGAHTSLVAAAAAGRRLHADRRRVHRSGSRGAPVGLPGAQRGHHPAVPGDPPVHHAAQPAGPGRDGARLPAADDGVHRRAPGHHRHRPHPPPRPRPATAGDVAAADDGPQGGDHPARPQSLLRRLQCADRRGGDRQRGAAVPGAPDRPGQADRDAARAHPRGHAPRPGRPGQALAHRPPDRSDRAEPDHGDGRRPGLGVLHHHDHHHDRARPGSQHLLRRAPRPGQSRGTGQLPPAPLHHPGGPTDLRERHRGARRPGGRPSRRRRWQHEHADPPLRHRGLHRLHPLAGRAGRALATYPSTSLATPGDDQRHRRVHHRHRHHRLPHLQVHRGGVGGRRRHPGIRLPLPAHPRLLRPGPQGPPDGRDTRPARTQIHHRHRAREPHLAPHRTRAL